MGSLAQVSKNTSARLAGATAACNPQEVRDQVLSAYLERTFGINRLTITSWIKKAKHLPNLSEKLLPAQSDDVLELDEVWSFVQKKANKSWLWIGLCRRMLEVVAYAVGGRGTEVCEQLKASTPQMYSHVQTVSDFLNPYKNVFGKNHKRVGKETGETSHVERWSNTLRQRLGRFVRKTLSFSKTQENHEASIKLFINEYNISARSKYFSA
jgi:IS1 family transposase